MKSIIFKLFVLIITFSCTNVFAQSINDTGANSREATISDVKFVKVYDVQLFWGEMKFSFGETENYVWNDETHEYYSQINKEWTSSGNTVTIQNKSNYEISAKLIYEGNDEYKGITGSFTKDLLNIGINKIENSKLNLSGNLSRNVNNYTKIGTITIMIY